MSLQARGGVKDIKAQAEASPREIWLLQRKASKPGKDLGKTTGWTHRLSLSQRGVRMIPGVNYWRIDDDGLHVEINGADRATELDAKRAIKQGSELAAVI